MRFKKSKNPDILCDDDCQKGFGTSKTGLIEAKVKNDKVIASFRVLLGDE